MNDAVQFVKNRLTAVPRPPNSGMSEEEILEQQREVQQRERERQEKMERLRRKKTEEEEDEDSDTRPSRIEDDKKDVQTPHSRQESQPEPQDTPKESRFMNKIRDAVHKVDERLDVAGEQLEETASRVYTRSKQGATAFVKDAQEDFNKALQHKPQRPRKASRPLVSPEARERSASFAIRDYERRHTPKQTAFSLSDDNNPSQNPYIGFSDMTGFGELDRGAFSLDASQFGFSLIGDSGMFQGQQFANEQPFGGFNVKQEHSFKVGYNGEFGAFRHSKNESFSFLPKPPKNTNKRKNNKARKSPRDFDISRLIF